MEDNVELWRLIEEFPNYEMSFYSFRIRRTKSHIELLKRQRYTSVGVWEFVRLRKDGKMYYRGFDKLYEKTFNVSSR